MAMAENSRWRRFLFRKIQVDIVTIFIVLLATSSLVIMFYTYNKNHENILDLSNIIVDKVSDEVVEKISDVTDDEELLSEVTRGFFRSNPSLSLSNKDLVSFLLDAVKARSIISSMNIATKNGDFLSVFDLDLVQFYYFRAEPAKPLPEGAKYAIRLIESTAKPPIETWQYLNTDREVVASEKFTPSFNPLSDPWYTKMQTWPRAHWSNTEFPGGASQNVGKNIPSLIVSSPVYDAQDNVTAVVGVSITLQQLSNFITHQKIGKNGRAYVLNENGTILIPPNTDTQPTQPMELVNLAYSQHLKTNKDDFLFSFNHIDYLASFEDFPLSLEKTWKIVVIVPFNDFFGEIIKTQRRTMLISLGILALFGFFIYLSSRHISVPIIRLAKDVDRIRHFDFSKPEEIRSHIIEINILKSSIQSMRAALHSFGRYIPKEIVQALIEKGQEIALGGERRQVTLMFSDISNFTTFSESLPIEKLTPFLAAYFDTLSKIILENQGTIDKYIGDSIMVFWGAPHEVADQEIKACVTALRCLQISSRKQKENPAENWTSRFGLHCGEAIVGNIGTEERMNYTVMGDTVNTAARLQELNKKYQTSIIISEVVQKRIGAKFITRPLDFLAVKGKTIKITIFELAGTTEGDLACTTDRVDLCREFTKAYNAFHEGKMEEAKNLFTALHQRFPSDEPTKTYLERIQSTKMQ